MPEYLQPGDTKVSTEASKPDHKIHDLKSTNPEEMESTLEMTKMTVTMHPGCQGPECQLIVEVGRKEVRQFKHRVGRVPLWW